MDSGVLKIRSCSGIGKKYLPVKISNGATQCLKYVNSCEILSVEASIPANNDRDKICCVGVMYSGE
jgi:hypothetical protein